MQSAPHRALKESPRRPPIPAEPTDANLVERCLAGDDRAWTTLIGRYKRLILSYCRRYGAYGDDAADVFQEVCAELFISLPRLRNHESVRSWMISVATHEAYRWKRRRLLRLLREGEEATLSSASHALAPAALIESRQREETVRTALKQLPPRCQQMLKMLFYQDPPTPYQAVAGELGLAIGSIGIVRGRCLRKLSRLLKAQSPR